MKTLNRLQLTTGAVLLTSFAAIPTGAVAAENFKFGWSGQVSRAATFADNGVDDDALFVDNNNSGTRLRVTGQVDVKPGLQAGINIETQFQDNSSSAQDIGDSDNSSSFASRKRELWFKGSWGKATLGQGDGAANGTSEVDFSGTTIADYSGNNLDDGISFVNSTGNLNDGTSVKNGSAFDNFDGLSRNDRIRYDTPNFGPIGIAVSAGQDRQELGLRYSNKLGGNSKIGAALGFVGSDGDGDNDFTQLGLSASYLHSSGFNLTGHYGEKDLDQNGRTDPEGIYVKVGQKLGSHNLSLSYHTVDDLAADGDEAERVNLAWVYNLRKGIEVFADYQNSSLDRAGGVSLEDVDQFSIGSRIKF